MEQMKWTKTEALNNVQVVFSLWRPLSTAKKQQGGFGPPYYVQDILKLPLNQDLDLIWIASNWIIGFYIHFYALTPVRQNNW